MAFATPQSIEEVTGVPADVASRAVRRQAAAARKLRRLLDAPESAGPYGSDDPYYDGDAFYEEVDADSSHEYREELTEAESLLCLYYALPAMNLVVDENRGIVRSTGWDDNRQELMSHRELEAYRDDFFSDAEDAIDKVLADRAETGEGARQEVVYTV